MAVKPEALAVLVGQRTGQRPPPVSYPGPSGVLYAPPNDDGSRKNCGNCSLWAERDMQCLIHSPDVEVGPDMVCGYHVFGEPQMFGSAIIRPTGIAPELSGLESVPGGTSCDECRFFDSGMCNGVGDPSTGQPPTPVEPLGCCARWEREP